MARSTTPIFKYQSTASALRGLMLFRSRANPGPNDSYFVISKSLFYSAVNATRAGLVPLNMLTDMPSSMIGFMKCGSHANTS